MTRTTWFIDTFEGQLFEGRHEHLVSDELFERVQASTRLTSSTRRPPRRHHHYLKGVLWCGSAMTRVSNPTMMMRAKGNGGRYRYFFGRTQTAYQCDSRYVEGEAIEAAIIEYYATLAFPAEMANELRLMMHQKQLHEEEGAHQAG